jgi:very-short-patch-repair endonuclease
MKLTDARKLAARLRREAFEQLFAQQLTAARVAPAIPQYKFALALGRKWTADFAWPDLKLLLEVDGGVWRRGGGAHSHPSNILRDMEKQNDAALLGWRVLRFTTGEIKSGHALLFLERVMDPRGTVPMAAARIPRVSRLTSRGLRARAVLVA